MTIYFCIGAHKTGTSSIRQAFNLLGFNCFMDSSKPYRYKNINQIIKIFNLNNNNKYDFFKDSPFNHFNNYKILHQNIKDSKFILTIRDPEDWYQSLKAFSIKDKNNNIKKHNIRLKLLKHIYKCNVTKNINKNKIIQLYQQRNQNIINYFKQYPTQLLIINLKQNTNKNKWLLLSNFTNINIKDVNINITDFPYKGKNINKNNILKKYKC